MRLRRCAILAAAAVAATETREAVHVRVKLFYNTFKISSLLVFNRVYRLELQSVMLVFSTPLVN